MIKHIEAQFSIASMGYNFFLVPIVSASLYIVLCLSFVYFDQVIFDSKSPSLLLVTTQDGDVVVFDMDARRGRQRTCTVIATHTNTHNPLLSVTDIDHRHPSAGTRTKSGITRYSSAVYEDNLAVTVECNIAVYGIKSRFAPTRNTPKRTKEGVSNIKMVMVMIFIST